MDSTSDPPPELPDELLNIIIRYASFHPRSAVHYREVIPEIVERFLPPTKGIQSLSLASHRLRQISLPYLFASIMINDSMGVSRLVDDCAANAHFARLITALVVYEVPDGLHELLSHLPHLEYVHLENETAKNEPLLVTLGNHQNIKHIVIPHFHDLPHFDDFLWHFDHLLRPIKSDINFSKILIHCLDIDDPSEVSALESHPGFQHMQVARISRDDLRKLNPMDATMIMPRGWTRFNGLRELSVDISSYMRLTPMFGLPGFVSAHFPSLRKILFVSRRGTSFQEVQGVPQIPFTIQLNKQIQQEQNKLGIPYWGSHEFVLRKVGVSLGHGHDQKCSNHADLDIWSQRYYGYPQDSDISELGFYVNNALHQLLTLSGPCFPNITILNLIFAVESTARYDIDDFIASLRHLPSLRQLELLNSYPHLQYREGAAPVTGEESIWDSDWVVGSVKFGDPASIVMVRSGMVWYTSRIARAIPSIESFFISERGPKSKKFKTRGWLAKIWLVGSELRG
ncbi:hypothetical protein FB446DRAFT_758271 [Lentinula raphanica]|nr:hypothetical protein FB446DRAFT_758271 [Lentinula raphanica]